MVVGSAETALRGDVEILKIGQDNAVQCDKPANISLINLTFGDGAYFDGSPTVCQYNYCVTYSFDSSEWTVSYEVSERRNGLRAVAIDDETGWITGGKETSST